MVLSARLLVATALAKASLIVLLRQNGKWVPAYYDAKNKVVKAQFQVPFVAGTMLEIRVKDAAGNVRVLQSSTPLAPFK